MRGLEVSLGFDCRGWAGYELECVGFGGYLLDFWARVSF